MCIRDSFNAVAHGGDDDDRQDDDGQNENGVINRAHFKVVTCGGAVSYTHLDVYKRQGKGPPVRSGPRGQ